MLWGLNPKTGERSPFPMVKLHNVVTFPGVPRFCQKGFSWVQVPPSSLPLPISSPEPTLPRFGAQCLLHRECLHHPGRVQVGPPSPFPAHRGFRFSDSLTALADKYSTKYVEIGSYPVLNNRFLFCLYLFLFPEKARLFWTPGPSAYQPGVYSDTSHCLPFQFLQNETHRGERGPRDGKDGRQRAQRSPRRYPFFPFGSHVTPPFPENLVHFDEEAWVNSVAKWDTFQSRQKDEAFVSRLDEARRIIAETLEKYSLHEIALSFNGGKDCTVLLHLLRVELDRYPSSSLP